MKGNIAHANCAAGATGLIKALAMMRAKSLAPTANFRDLNPKIDLRRLGGLRRFGVDFHPFF